MKPQTLVELYSLVNEMFPVPTNATFKGRHNFTLSPDGLELCIWKQSEGDDRIRCHTFTFSPNSPTSIEEDLVEIKEQLAQL